MEKKKEKKKKDAYQWKPKECAEEVNTATFGIVLFKLEHLNGVNACPSIFNRKSYSNRDIVTKKQKVTVKEQKSLERYLLFIPLRFVRTCVFERICKQFYFLKKKWKKN